MTRIEVEMALTELMEKAVAIAKEYNPAINHLSITCVNDHIMVMAHEWDSEKEDYAQPNILSSSQFVDGEFKSWDNTEGK